MAYAFISYLRDDEAGVRRLARALEAEGIELSFDLPLVGNVSFSKRHEKLDHAGCVIVAWSAGSARRDGDLGRDEARWAMTRQVLGAVQLDELDYAGAPLGFPEVGAFHLAHWAGDRGDPRFQQMVAEVRAKLTGQKPSGRIYLSYAREDRDAAKALSSQLVEAGFDVRLDQTLVHGGSFESQIEAEIKDCAVFVPVISKST